uniref:Immunoglobulin V-set domain-containing protein n=1 Tax=Pseudonaja textilis TaxID=8673 RepID=A0A670ZNB7_PSETE
EVQLVESGSGFTFSGGYLHWVTQILESPWSTDPNSVYYSDKVQGQFIISRDYSSSLMFLQMNSLKTEDTAIYYLGGGGPNQWNPIPVALSITVLYRSAHQLN